MNANEKLLVEAVRSMLSDRAKLGLAFHGEPEERSHMVQFQQQGTEDMFRIKINKPEITHYEAVSGAFFHTHSYRNLDDPQFELAFRKQMSGMTVPPDQQDLAVKYLGELRNELEMPVRDTGRRIDMFSASAEEANGAAHVDDLREVTQPTNEA